MPPSNTYINISIPGDKTCLSFDFRGRVKKGEGKWLELEGRGGGGEGLLFE